MKVGDVVLVLSQDLPRGRWPLGHVERVYLAPNHHVRVVDVCIRGQVYHRSIGQLCPLAANQDVPDV